MSRHIIVTGASRGIGAAIADEFVRLGDRVTGWSRTGIGPSSLTDSLSVDVSDSSSVAAAMKTSIERHGAPDAVVINAGVTRDGLAIRMSDEQWHEVVATNLSGAFYCARAALSPMIRARQGSLVFIGSVGPFMGVAGQANYAATKSGLVGLARSLASEVASRGITVNVVAPGLVATDMTTELSGREDLVAQIPLQRIGEPSDVSGVVAFLTSTHARYITGQVLCVDGGLGMGW
jgi:3-oxoacyl-[acyl-carrier protein] reductase